MTESRFANRFRARSRFSRLVKLPRSPPFRRYWAHKSESAHISVMTFSLITFEEAINESASRRRHLLLGNGFSIGAFPKFKYNSLVAEACRLDPSVEPLFAGVTDFEKAMATAPAHAVSHLRRVFIQTIAHIHPRRDDVLAFKQREACADFLAHFLRGRSTKNRGYIFTTNYDLMLYWVIVDQKKKLRYVGDGFGHNFTWRNNIQRDARVFYLHGGMHLYETESSNPYRALRVITKMKAGDGPASNLVDRVRQRVERGEIPILVSEGNFQEKRGKIEANSYLRKARDVFAEVCRSDGDVLFTYGHSLSAVDSHIAAEVWKGRLPRVYVGWFSDWDLERAQRLAEWWSGKRAGRPAIEVKAYDASKVKVWGE